MKCLYIVISHRLRLFWDIINSYHQHTSKNFDSKMLPQLMTLLILAFIQLSASFQFYPSRTVPSSWFQDSSKYLQPIADAENDYKDHDDDMDIAASEFNNEHIDRMATDLKRISHGNVEAKRDQVAASSGDNHGGRVQIKVYRGPDSGGHDQFAPYGYWVKQPADYDHH